MAGRRRETYRATFALENSILFLIGDAGKFAAAMASFAVFSSARARS